MKFNELGGFDGLEENIKVYAAATMKTTRYESGGSVRR